KPLTRFEHVKAELQKCIREAYKEDTTQVDEFMRKIDCDWTDMLWQYRNSGTMTDEDSVIDDEFLRYFYYICDIIGYKNCVNRRENEDEFELLKKFIAVNDTFDTDGVRNNIQIMKSYFDCWYRIYKNDQRNDLIDGFFKSFIDHNSGNGKIVFYSSNDEINIFKDCLRSYTDKNGKFNKARAVLLYAVIE
ncbi:MAG: hypothetical protein IJG02_10750, partial [Thermoguttaceae bacterium]|nr:hypothetical protein [Thermoguttaceae bacterium]